MQKRSVTRLVKPRNFIHPDDTVILEDEKHGLERSVNFNTMAAGVSVDIMSGLNDPANSALPQQHLTTCFRSCTNPRSFDVDNIRFLGTSGQNIDKYSEAESKLDFVERTLRWRHLAPTAPNTLG
ncbi:hypothetical protein Bca52824_049929 [Brassica carinata]|uniref:DNA polymerase alpha/delta/epsilon subunit B domain-containing protein n=1 Tax=Brassica carinata TaxID=52824 RepID=A0A8X7US85_BRACI|nr:hypothetical protein Bca52824_049929 [Brassica carinata]